MTHSNTLSLLLPPPLKTTMKLVAVEVLEGIYSSEEDQEEGNSSEGAADCWGEK